MVQIQRYKDVESERTDKVIHSSKELKASSGSINVQNRYNMKILLETNKGHMHDYKVQ